MMKKVPRKLRIVAGGPYELPNPPFETHYDDSEDPRIRELAIQYGLETLVKDAQSELEIFFRLQNYVKVKMVEHGWSFHEMGQPAKNATEVLRAVEQGIRFHCYYHAMVFSDFACALGYVTRTVGARMPDVEFDATRKDNVGHEVVEIWSNTLGKWILIDCDTNSHYEKDGIPQSASELCIAANKDLGADVKMVFGEYLPPMTRDTGGTSFVKGTMMTPNDVEKMEKIFMENQVMDYYKTIVVMSRNDRYAAPDEKPEVLAYIPEGENPLLVYNGEAYHEVDLITSRQSVVDYSVNQTAIKVELMSQHLDCPEVRITLFHNMPNFFAFQEYDGSHWIACKKINEKYIREGMNEFRFRAVNRRGIPGGEAFVQIMFEK